MQRRGSGRVCRVVAVVPESRWRSPAIPEYKVELLALPVSAYRRHDQLVPLMGETTSELAVAG